MNKRNLLFFIISFLQVSCLQIQAQEIKTKEEAIRFFNNWGKHYVIIDYYNNSQWHYITKTTLENQYIVFNLKLNNGLFKLFMIDLTDSLHFDLVKDKEVNKIFDKYFKFTLLMNKKHGYIINRYLKVEGSGVDVVWKDVEKTNTEFYEALKLLKKELAATDKEEYKLSELKKGKLTYPKTEISEEQRKYIVQANAANEKKEYENALLLFRKAIEINPYSYPAAYFNMALIHGNLDNYYQAVYAMKQYLIIVPNAEDARKAQDKIYEWETNIYINKLTHE